MNLPATRHQIECMELAALNNAIEKRRMQERLAHAEAMAIRSEEKRRAEKARHEEEVKIIVCGTAGLFCVGLSVMLLVTAPWWAAFIPLVFGAAIIRKAGW